MRGLAAGGYRGVNLTVPHKETALALVDRVSDEARRIGAINTIFIDPAGRLQATNTDAYGFIANLKAVVPGFAADRGPAVILGAGGAARAVCFALQAAGAREIRLVNRTATRAEILAHEFAPGISRCAVG